ncbi:hypothetical protein N7281_03040 [Rickettsia hoogstraalii]|uniref:hypothetical protein n=1 Tax=Rickettsia hoogstraalii TaxID=467174 RepID=UPI0022584CC1|nr:hypothetical protein [Rickettsia hoogstraalii]MCX4083850.1 hypothetical protein [Rickettsia hoogstraalii]
MSLAAILSPTPLFENKGVCVLYCSANGSSVSASNLVANSSKLTILLAELSVLNIL